MLDYEDLLNYITNKNNPNNPICLSPSFSELAYSENLCQKNNLKYLRIRWKEKYSMYYVCKETKRYILTLDNLTKELIGNVLDVTEEIKMIYK